MWKKTFCHELERHSDLPAGVQNEKNPSLKTSSSAGCSQFFCVCVCVCFFIFFLKIGGIQTCFGLTEYRAL